METNTARVILTPDQQQRLDSARKGLNYSVIQCKEELLFNKESMLIRRAQQGINALSLAEASWLNQKKWSPVEKTFILWHVDNERNKKKNKSVSLYDIGITAGLALTATAAHLDGYRHLTTMLSVLTAAKALGIAIDCIKDHTVEKMTNDRVNELSTTNDNVRTGIRCLTPRTTYMR